ncbi:putative c6 zinc finger domain-containing protein [Neofusicoccum parvum UCRNP2]|uniref:Putative c6 zinc finger domain-containing protein n=1 Tax=Botryosphaeria parva (strain UCR-NP2) TaxID=1287680 RepID=R1E879_BOTPV|nr:putative c6 zinc finger domain-containing protein [Neofusicoccum parvum UCRNP2]
MAAHLASFDFASMSELAPPIPAGGPLSAGAAAAAAGAMDAQQLSSSSSGGKQPIPLACVACRSKHLKCSGGEPCSRCAADGTECSYVKSRRGYKGPRKRTAGSVTEQATTAGFSASPPEQQHSPAFPALEVLTGGDQASSPSQLNCFAFQAPEDMAVAAQNQVAVAPKTTSGQQVGCNNLSMVTSAFFTFFAAAHPFLLPRQYLLDLLRNKRLPHLELAIQYIGSCYLPQASTQMLDEALNHALFQQNQPRDGSMVQALLLYSIGLKSNDKSSTADEMLSQAIDIALAIGMNDREFSIRNGSGNRVLEESWRRTWWELYVVDGFFAGVSQRTNFRLRDVLTDVPLPCEEVEYESGYIPVPRTFEEYDDAAFADDDVEFSSFAYRIDSVRNLGKVLAVTSIDVLDIRAIEGADAYLVNWALHLPNSKRETISRDGQLDHMLFQAHMIANASTILLHKPRSNLDEYRSADDIRTCVRQCSPLISTQTRETHTAKCMDASQRLSQLVRLPCPLTRLTPFFTCAVVMSSVVYLSAWSFVAPQSDGSAAQDSTPLAGSCGPATDAALKELIRLNMGALKNLAGQWPLARTAAGQVRGVAGELFRAKKEVRRLWNEVAAEDILRMIEDAASESGSGSGSFPAGGMVGNGRVKYYFSLLEFGLSQ